MGKVGNGEIIISQLYIQVEGEDEIYRLSPSHVQSIEVEIETPPHVRRNKSLPLKKRHYPMEKKSAPAKKKKRAFSLPDIVLREQRRSPSVVSKASKAVQRGRLTYGEASRMYGVPKSSIFSRVKNGVEPNTRGPKRVLNDPEEDRLIRFINLMHKLANPLTWQQIAIVVGEIVAKSERPQRKGFKDGCPSEFHNDISTFPTCSARYLDMLPRVQ